MIRLIAILIRLDAANIDNFFEYITKKTVILLYF